METMEQLGSADCAKHFPAALEEVCGLSGAFEIVLDHLCNRIGSCNISSNEFCQVNLPLKFCEVNPTFYEGVKRSLCHLCFEIK